MVDGYYDNDLDVYSETAMFLSNLVSFILQQPQLDQVDRRRTAIDILRVTSHAGRRTNSSPTDWGVWCPHLAQAARVKKYDYPQVAGAVLGEERVQQALETAAKESVNEKRQELLDAGQSDDTFDEDAYYNETMRKHEKRAHRVSHVNTFLGCELIVTKFNPFVIAILLLRVMICTEAPALKNADGTYENKVRIEQGSPTNYELWATNMI